MRDADDHLLRPVVHGDGVAGAGLQDVLPDVLVLLIHEEEFSKGTSLLIKVGWFYLRTFHNVGIKWICSSFFCKNLQP